MGLIASPRHTRADLEAWAVLERHDAVISRLTKFNKACDDALASIVSFAHGTEYAGVSFGKDSTVLFHLVSRAHDEHGIVIPLVWIKVRPISNPHCDLVRDELLARFRHVRYDEIVVDCAHDEGGWHATGTLERGFEQAAQRHGPRHISGIRGAESGQRKKRMMMFGVESKNTLAPIGWWPTAWVYAYLRRYDLPVHPAYAMLMNGTLDRDRIRVASLGGERGKGWGRAEWEEMYYREEVHALGRGPV